MFLALLLRVALASVSNGCSSADGCTAGRVTRFVGDIQSGAQLRAMLQARAPDKELIIIVASCPFTLELALLQYART